MSNTFTAIARKLVLNILLLRILFLNYIRSAISRIVNVILCYSQQQKPLLIAAHLLQLKRFIKARLY